MDRFEDEEFARLERDQSKPHYEKGWRFYVKDGNRVFQRSAKGRVQAAHPPPGTPPPKSWWKKLFGTEPPQGVPWWHGDHELNEKGICIHCHNSETAIHNFGWACTRTATQSAPSSVHLESATPGDTSPDTGRALQQQLRQLLDGHLDRLSKTTSDPKAFSEVCNCLKRVFDTHLSDLADQAAACFQTHKGKTQAYSDFAHDPMFVLAYSTLPCTREDAPALIARLEPSNPLPYSNWMATLLNQNHSPYCKHFIHLVLLCRGTKWVMHLGCFPNADRLSDPDAYKMFPVELMSQHERARISSNR